MYTIGQVSELFDVADLQAGPFQALDHAKGFQLFFSEFPDAGVSLHRREQPLPVIIPQCGYRQIKHLGYLTDGVHEAPSNITEKFQK